MPGLRIQFPLSEIQAFARKAARLPDDPQTRRPMLQEIARTLKDMALAAFDAKAAGGTGSDGITWKNDRPETWSQKKTNRIGVESGEMRSSLKGTVGEGGADVAIVFTAPHAKHFDRRRTLLPEKLPSAWNREVERIVVDRMTRALQKKVNDTNITGAKR